VRGEVRNPALYTVPLEMTLGGAIAVAGGPTPEAQLRKVTLVRDQRSYHLDLSDPAAPWTATPIRSGDQIIIGRKNNLFFGTILPLVTASAALASLISVLRRNWASLETSFASVQRISFLLPCRGGSMSSPSRVTVPSPPSAAPRARRVGASKKGQNGFMFICCSPVTPRSTGAFLIARARAHPQFSLSRARFGIVQSWV